MSEIAEEVYYFTYSFGGGKQMVWKSEPRKICFIFYLKLFYLKVENSTEGRAVGHRTLATFSLWIASVFAQNRDYKLCM